MMAAIRRTIQAMAFLIPLTASPMAGAAESGGEQTHVRQALDTFFDAAAEADWRSIEQMLTADFEFFTDGTTVLGRDEFVAAMKDDSMAISKLELSDVDIFVSPDGRMAFVRYRAHLESMIKGEPYNMNSAETVVFEKQDGQWRMSHNHASVKTLE